MKRYLLAAVVLIISGACAAQSIDPGDAFLTICNKGVVEINVTTAIGSGFFDRDLKVHGWQPIEPGKCKLVYQEPGGPATYLGFGFFDKPGHFVAGRVAQVPDFGWSAAFGQRALTKSNKKLCASDDGMRYIVPKDRELNCATFRADSGDRFHYFPFDTTLYFNPKTQNCSASVSYGPVTCAGGDYYLNLRAIQSTGEIQAFEGTKETDGRADVASDTSGQDFLRALAKAAEDEKLKKQEANQQQESVQMQARQRYADSVTQDWRAARYPAGANDPSLMRKSAVIAGTVSHVDVQDGHPAWVTIYLKEWPKGDVVICSPYPRMLEGMFGDLSRLAGRKLEASGQIEGAMCSNTAIASLRVLGTDRIREAVTIPQSSTIPTPDKRSIGRPVR